MRATAKHPRSPRRLLVAGMVLALTALVGCSGGGEDAMSAGRGGDAGGAAAEAPEEATDQARGAANRTSVRTRAVIRSGTVSVVAQDLAKARTEVDGLLARYGGHIAQEDTSHDAKGRPQGSTLVLRFPEPDFDTAMTELSKLGRLEGASREAEDVTTEVIDVNTRVSTQEASLNRLEGFLRQATSIEDIIRLESEITTRQAQLESLKAQQAYLADQTSLSTITLFLATPANFVEPNRLEDAGFLAGLSDGWNALKLLLVAAATLTGALLPFAVALAVVAIPTWLLVRTIAARRGHGAKAPVVPPTTEAADES